MVLRRPRSIAELVEANSHFVTDESWQRGVGYQPAPSDIFISPFAKCGTTWMQQIVHGLRSNGSMDFDEITQVVPWLELAHDMGWDVTADQVATPRAFKSHLRWDEIPKGGRYIVVLRDPGDALLSFYRFCEGWRFETGAISLDDFATYYLERDDWHSYWGHAASWWRVRERADVLLVSFETMKADLPGVVRRVADFTGLGGDADRVALATRQARFGFMKAHGAQFDDHLLRAARDRACGLPPGGAATKVDRGQTGHRLSPDIHAALDGKWQATLGAEFGLADYAALRQALDG